MCITIHDTVSRNTSDTVTIRFTIGSYTDTLTKDQIDSEREKVLTALKNNNMYINE